MAKFFFVWNGMAIIPSIYYNDYDANDNDEDDDSRNKLSRITWKAKKDSTQQCNN